MLRTCEAGISNEYILARNRVSRPAVSFLLREVNRLGALRRLHLLHQLFLLIFARFLSWFRGGTALFRLTGVCCTVPRRVVIRVTVGGAIRAAIRVAVRRVWGSSVYSWRNSPGRWCRGQ